MPHSLDLVSVAPATAASPALPLGSSAPFRAPLRLAVGIATRGRPEVLMQTLAGLLNQTLKPVAVLVAYIQPSDVGQAPESFPEVIFFQSQPGLTRQRNAILDALPPADVLVFLDDDFCLGANYLLCMQQAFSAHQGVVVATGHVVADGINGPGLTVTEARDILSRPDHLPAAHRLEAVPVPVFNAYGCNMCLRLDLIRARNLRFDENLPLYGWYEDVEFSRQMAPFGEIVKVPGALGVHLGTKSGRVSGLRLGYSQVANPLYLARRGSVPWSYAIASMLSRSLKNLTRCIWPESFVDRRGRLAGNLRACRDLITGEIHPLRAGQL